MPLYSPIKCSTQTIHEIYHLNSSQVSVRRWKNQTPDWPLMEVDEQVWAGGCCYVENVQLNLFKEFLSHPL